MVDVNVQRGAYRISTDKSKLDREFVRRWLKERSYWAGNRTAATVEASINNSTCFGLFEDERQIGFARVVSDYATFAWLCDVFIEKEFQGRGLGKWLVETIVNQSGLKELRIFLLATRDAHGLYEKYGEFQLLKNPGHWMMRPIPENA